MKRMICIIGIIVICLFVAVLPAQHVPYMLSMFNDALFRVYDNGDATKLLAFELDAITTGTTRTIYVGDADGNTANWNTTYGWGDHASEGYLKADGSVALAGAWDMGSQNLTNVDIDSGTIDGVSIGSASAVTYLKVDNLILNANTITTATGDLILSSSDDDVDITASDDAVLTAGDEINLIAGGMIEIRASGDTDDYIQIDTSAHVPEISTSGSCDLKISAGGGASLVINSGWTAAGQTCADLGTVTTANIDGGTLDGVAIGATSTQTEWDASYDHSILTSGNPHSVTPAELSLVIGTDVQAYDAGLLSLAGLTYASDSFIKVTAEDTYAIRTLAETADDVLGAGTINDLSDAVTFNPADNELLAYDTGTSKWINQTLSEAGLGDVTAAANLTDNTIIKGDGGAKGVQDSGVTIDDSDNITGIADVAATTAKIGNVDIAGRTITWDSGPLYFKEAAVTPYLKLDFTDPAAVILSAEAVGDAAGLALTSDAGVDYVWIWNKDLYIDNDLKIGSASAGVDYTLTFDGESDDCVMTYDEDNNILDFGDTDITTTGTITGGTLTDGTFSVTGGAVTGATGNISMWTNDSGYITTVALNDLSDVTIFNPIDNDLLAYDTGTSKWIQQTMAQAGFGTIATQAADSVNIDGGTIDGVAIGATSTQAEWDAAYTHSQDNTQAHTDYLLNSGADTTAGTLTAIGGFVTSTGGLSLADVAQPFFITITITAGAGVTVYNANAPVAFKIVYGTQIITAVTSGGVTDIKDGAAGNVICTLVGASVGAIDITSGTGAIDVTFHSIAASGSLVAEPQGKAPNYDAIIVLTCVPV